MKRWEKEVKRLEAELFPKPNMRIGEWHFGACYVDGEVIPAERVEEYRADRDIPFVEVARAGFGRL